MKKNSTHGVPPTALLIPMILLTLHYSVAGLPQGNKNQAEEKSEPMPYEFQYEVKEKEAKPSGIFMRHEEKAGAANPGRTEGEYQVWLPDGRLMKVAYYVDGDSGFVPTVTFEDNHVPSWK